MPKSFKYHGRTFTVGERVEVSSKGSSFGLGSVGEHLTIGIISNDKAEETQIGLVCDSPRSRWHDLEGRCKSHCGYWVSVNKVYSGTVPAATDYTVKSNFIFKHHNLRGKSCRQLGVLENGRSALVELEENVGGGSGDGLGKHGHCVLIPAELLIAGKQKKAAQR